MSNPTEFATDEYILLDSGNEMKLERVGEYTLIRPSPQAIWRPRLDKSEWNKADAVFTRTSDGEGAWDWRRKVKRDFDILYNNIAFNIRLTNFGHLGLFPEQAANWDWMRGVIRKRLLRTNYRNLHVLNLFAYTGGSTLACSQAGAHLLHLDAAKGVVDWARKTAKTCHMDERPIRWLVDDAVKFVEREVRRKHTYQGIIFDPPSFGRGPKGEVFKIEQDLVPLLEACKELLAQNGLFLLYSCHTPGFTPLTLENQLADVVADRKGKLESGEMTVAEPSGRKLPSGAYVRWLAEE